MAMSKKPAAPNPKDMVYPNGMTGENVVTDHLSKTWSGFSNVKSPSNPGNAGAKYIPGSDKP